MSLSSSSSSTSDTGSSDMPSDGDSMQYLYNTLREARALADTGSSRKYVKRNRQHALRKLMSDYFDPEPVFDDEHFRGTFRLTKRLFLEIVRRIQESGNPFFQEGYDGRRKKSFTTLQKCVSALQQLADGNPANQNDKYLKMAARTSRECLLHFCDAVVSIYKDEYLRRPTSHDIALLQQAHERIHHIPVMIGSIDCTHFAWGKCPTRLHGQYKRGCYPGPTIMLEAVASYDLWIWHAYFGSPGSNNDINVLNMSSLFEREREGMAPPSSFVVNNHLYERGYYLADDGYPNWSTFVKSYAYPADPKEKRFKKVQESTRKDVERAFGSLKGRWGILRQTLRQKSKARIRKVVNTCIILNNMLVKEDDRAICLVHIRDLPLEGEYQEEIAMQLRNAEACFRLRFDLTEHVGAQFLPHLDLVNDEDEDDE